MLEGTTRVLAARGKKVLEFESEELDDRAALEKAIIGPSGNLRAPTARLGKTLLVGFSEAMWAGAVG